MFAEVIATVINGIMFLGLFIYLEMKNSDV